MIGAAIDEQIQNSIPNLVGIRYVDDFYLYFATRAEAEEALAKLIAAAKDFELELNQTKTEIIELPESLEPRWKTELRSFVIKPEVQRLDLLGFFSRAFELANIFPGHNVLKYAAARSSGVTVEQDNWPLYESFLLTSLVGEPALFPVLAQLLTKYRDTGYPLDLGKLASTLWEICRYHCRFQQGFEVAWALWLAKLFELVVPDDVCSEIATLDDPVVAIVALDLRDSGFVMNLDTSSRVREPLIQPSLSLSRLVEDIGIRKLIRQNFGRRIVEKIKRRELVKASTYRDYERRIEEYERRRQRPKRSL